MCYGASVVLPSSQAAYCHVPAVLSSSQSAYLFAYCQAKISVFTDLRVEPTANCEIHPTTYCLHIALSHTQRVGPVLATPSNPSISSASPTVVPMKRKHSEDTIEVYPQKKVTLPAALENGPRGHRAVHSKAKCNEGSFSLHPSSKVAHSDLLVITCSLKPEQTLMVIQEMEDFPVTKWSP
ncbi:hypothetical protein F5141DRAFT_1060279 [Pisolithus sp. B1]|nr:hypothetical protein F5141DRAFT_1060279 [Pisolithus sp. B1]